MSNVLVTQGTELPIVTDTVGTLRYQVVKLDIGTLGNSTPFTGGVILNTGTINVGTVDSISQLPPAAFATTITSGTNTLGTLKSAVGGSVIYVTDLIVSVGGSASDVVIASGGTSTPIVNTLSFGANGGLVSNFRIPLQTASGSALVYKQSISNTLSITCSGYVK